MPVESHQVDNVKSYFDIHSRNWQDLYQKFERVNDLVLRDRKDIALSFLTANLEPGTRVLDVGCGAGLAALDAVREGYFVHGIDIAPQMIELSRRNFSESNVPGDRYLFTEGDVTDLDIPERSFDGILALGFLEYQKDEHGVLSHLNTLLKPGGVLVLSGPIRIKLSNFFGFALVLIKVVSMLKRIVLGKQYRSRTISLHKYNVSRMRSVLDSTGFLLMDFKRHGYANFFFIQKALGFKGEFFLHRLFTGMSRILPVDRFANDLVVVAKKKENFRDGA